MQSISKCNLLVNSIRMCVVSCSGIAIDGHAHTNTSYSIASMQQSLVYWTHLLSCGPGDETNVLLDNDSLTRPCL